ncbi:hypothetical protein Q73_13310 [Bacillus coahuilensis m2-6]|uniref:hypothetical protein n=1 Tax=Bacillus coahuilensis TaxID=408580 RepID=UPI000185131E|nr:hypothetical protein [Bacillus coahuilensis]KUP05403.1 hypothetical protein Q73_13310 [Bacillus coahuilensis m2-6]
MQDKFEIELRYGQDFSNHISTISDEKTEILPGGETVTESDFDLSDSVIQEVYKRLVLANYLGG